MSEAQTAKQRRTDAEQAIRDAVTAKLKMFRPGARIIHEINACHGGNRFDILAVGLAELIAVELKSEKDKLDRAPDQIAAMRGAAHHWICAIHEKFLIETKTNPGAAHYERDGIHYRHSLPPQVRRASEVWVFPELPRACEVWPREGIWREPELKLQMPLPESALAMLWHEELLKLCRDLHISIGSKRPTKKQMTNALRWYASGGDLTKGICAALRARECIEADERIEE